MRSPWYPRIHPRPAAGWVNDPNGIGYWDGVWHVMCQYNPGAAIWGDIHWAHLTSPDLVSWSEEPVALAPRAGQIDAWGVWSGVAYPLEDGTAALVYTAIPEDAGASGARAAIARPASGAGGWRQPPAGVTAAAPPGVRDVRDPFLFTWQGRRLAIQGAGTDDGEGLVLVYDASDLDSWTLLGTLLRGTDPVATKHAPARLWECPQLLEVQGTWVLVLSLWDDTAQGAAGHGPQRVAWLTGELREDDGVPTFVPARGGSLDDGTAFYAPQCVMDPTSPEPRVLLWGWLWEGRRSAPPAGLEAQDWAGCLTLPREVFLREGIVNTRLVREIDSAFPVWSEHRGTCTPPAATPWLARVGERPGSPAHRPEPATITVRLDLETNGVARTAWEGRGFAVELAFDGSVLEAFLDGTAHSHRIYPQSEETLVITAADTRGAAATITLGVA